MLEGKRQITDDQDWKLEVNTGNQMIDVQHSSVTLNWSIIIVNEKIINHQSP